MLKQTLGGKFGRFGGRFVPETLMSALEELEDAYKRFKVNSAFREELNSFLINYAGRPTPIYHAKNLSAAYGLEVYLKREDLAHGGAHKINNTLGQALLAKRMGKSRIIAETGAGQHGVATAMACAALGLKCEVYMGSEDMDRQRLNVYRMRLLGAELHPVESGSRTLKDAINEAFRDWVTNVETTYYLIGSVVGPHPYPTIVRDFQSVIGSETRKEFLEKTGRLPNILVACVGGGSNAIGTFHPFLEDSGVEMYGVEAGGLGLGAGQNAAPLCVGYEGVFHGMQTYILQDASGQISETQSISAGLDYPGVGPEHSFLKSIGRVQYVTATDEEALEAFVDLSRMEGILPALESSHALAYCRKLSRTCSGKTVVVTLSGRGDKDVEVVAKRRGDVI